MTMEATRLDPNKTMAIEVLSFDGVELEKTIGGNHSFATIGTLEVLYFKEYSLFILSLNSWKYVLLKSLPIIKASQNYTVPITYILPIDDGFFTLKLTKISHIEAVQNFEIILGRNCAFKCSSEALALLRGDGPDHITREDLYGSSERFSHSSQSSFFSPSKGAELGKTDLIKREILKAFSTISQELHKRRTENYNLTHLREYDCLINTTEDRAPAHFILRSEVEREIVNSRRLVKLIEEDQPLTTEGYTTGRKSFIRSFKDNLKYFKNEFISRDSHQTQRIETNEYSTHESNTLSNLKDKLKTIVEGDHYGQEGKDKLLFESHLPPELIQKMKGKSPERLYHGENPHADTTSPSHRLSVVEKIKLKLPEMLSCRGENRDEGGLTIDSSERRRGVSAFEQENLHRDEEFHPSLLDRIKSKLPETFHRHREPFQDRTNEPYGYNEEPRTTFKEKVRDSIRGAREQVYGCVNTVAQNEEVHTLVVKMKEGYNGIKDKFIHSERNMENSDFNNRQIDPNIQAGSISSFGEYGIEPVEIQPIRDNIAEEPHPSLLDKIKAKIPEIKERLHLIDHHKQHPNTFGMGNQYTRQDINHLPEFEPNISNYSRQYQYEAYQPERQYRGYEGQREGYGSYQGNENRMRDSSETWNREFRRDSHLGERNENRSSAGMFAGMLYSEG